VKQYRGAIHIHTTYSDGSGTPEEIIALAKQARLDFIVITDHDTLEPLHDGWQGYHDGVLVIVGVEISPQNRAHILAFGADDVKNYNHLTEAECLERISAQGGTAFVAHPEGAYRRNLGIDLERWRLWMHSGFSGIEVWSFMHDWIKGFRWFRLFDYHGRPLAKIAGPEPHLVALWDQLNIRRRVSGIAALDAHAKQLLWMKFFPYEFLFNTTLTYVECAPLAGDADADIKTILDALVGARCFMAFEPYASARGFQFTGRGDGFLAGMGDRVSGAKVDSLVVEAPELCNIRLVRNGKIVDEVTTDHLEYGDPEPGAWRAEAWLEGFPWIFSNHITLLD